MTPLYIDDIQLVKQSENILNGDFENSELGDTIIEEFSIGFGKYEITNDAISGEKSLKIIQDEAGKGGTICPDNKYNSNGTISNLSEGTYISSVWIKSPTNSEKNKKIVFKNSTSNTKYSQDLRVYGWTLNAVILNVGEGDSVNTSLTALTAETYANMEYLIDEWSLETVEYTADRILTMLKNFDMDNASQKDVIYLLQWTNFLFKNGMIPENEISKFRVNIGDVNLNGTINSADLVYMRHYLLGLNKIGDSSLVDVNGDGSSDIRDLVALKHRLIDFAY